MQVSLDHESLDPVSTTPLDAMSPLMLYIQTTKSVYHLY